MEGGANCTALYGTPTRKHLKWIAAVAKGIDNTLFVVNNSKKLPSHVFKENCLNCFEDDIRQLSLFVVNILPADLRSHACSNSNTG